MLSIVKKGTASIISDPIYGKQATGVSPGGPMDSFSVNIAKIMLGCDSSDDVVEFSIVPPAILIECDGYIVSTGAHRDTMVNNILIEQNRSVYVSKGDIITFGNIIHKGLYTYIVSTKKINILCRTRKPFSNIASWTNSPNIIRVTKGPEYDYIIDDFKSNVFKTTNKMSRMGIRIEPINGKIKCTKNSMISEAVADGTVQLSPNGPIILMRDRQTIGGYPRIYNIIDADIDVMSQLKPNTIFRFVIVSVEEADNINKKKDIDIQNAMIGNTWI